MPTVHSAFREIWSLQSHVKTNLFCLHCFEVNCFLFYNGEIVLPLHFCKRNMVFFNENKFLMRKFSQSITVFCFTCLTKPFWVPHWLKEQIISVVTRGSIATCLPNLMSSLLIVIVESLVSVEEDFFLMISR